MAEPTAEELYRFYDERSKPTKTDRFQFDKQGNLVEFDRKGTLVKTIVLPVYRPPTEEEIREMEKDRLEKIAVANHDFEDARRRLYQALQEKTSSRSDILELNREVRNADIVLQTVRFPLRGVTTESRMKIKELDFDQPQESRVFPYDIAFSHVRPFTLQQQYVRVGDIPLPPVVSVAEAKQEETIILFSDQDMETSVYGFLALAWPVSIPFHDQIYASARHAIFAELAKEFGDQERAEAIQATESAKDIHYTVDEVAGGKEVNQMKWNTTLSRLIDMVNMTKFKKYPELAQRLMELPSPVIIGADEPNDSMIGIGLSMNNVKAKDKLAWTGENLLGKALMKIRENLLAERAQMAAQVIKRPRKRPTVVTTQAAPDTVPLVSEVTPPVEEPSVLPPPVLQPVQPPQVLEPLPVSEKEELPVQLPSVPSTSQIASSAPLRRRPRIVLSSDM